MRKLPAPVALLDDSVVCQWLDWQCSLLPCVREAALYRLDAGDSRTEVALWPETARQTEALWSTAQHALRRNGAFVLNRAGESGSDEEHWAFALPGGKAVWVMSLIHERVATDKRKRVLHLLMRSARWLADAAPARHQGRAGIAGLEPGELSHRLIRHSRPEQAAIELANYLASVCGAERISVGRVRAGEVQLLAVSRHVQLDRRLALATALEAAMQESVDEACCLRWQHLAESRHDPTEGHSLLAQRALARAESRAVIISQPLCLGGDCVAALTAEFDTVQGHASEPTLLNTATATSLALIFALLQAKSMTVPERLQARWRRLRHDIAPRQAVAIAVFAATLLGAVALVPWTYQIGAEARIEGADRQLLVAAQAGFVRRVLARAGDTVRAGELLAKLDDRELRLERARWISELGKLKTAQAQALAQHDRQTVGMQQADIRRVQAELALVDQRLERTDVTAPFNGVLIAGDLDQSLNAPVEAGDVLFELASLQNYRLVVDVEEHDIAQVLPGQSGKLRLAAFPDRTWNITVASLMPVAITNEGGNVFRVLASLDEVSPVLRPGMRGVAQLQAGKRSLWWIWTHDITERLRLLWWRWVG